MSNLRSFLLLAVMAFASVTGAGAQSVPSKPTLKATSKLLYSRDIQPILSDKCYTCHGPDAAARKAGLRLDQAQSALRKENPVIVPGNSSVSELVKRITAQDPDEKMPPPTSHRTLTPQQIAQLKQWIDEGAVWGKHWSFEPPQRAALPAVKNKTWARNPIDRFVLAKLEQSGLTPSPEASKETLIRRVTLDLTGLPPTPQETAAFLADHAPDAYEKVVDGLLQSPRFGERMVWEWLEAARYADTNGYQGDPTRPMYYWRDWVINALNRNMPYDQFTVEQLAGDLLPNPTRDQLIATGFHRNHMINGEGGRIPEESRVDYVRDRVETTSTVWMGLTLQCARCHDHKFDPLTQRDYYQVSAYFNSVDETGANDAGGLANPVLSMPSPEQTQRLEALRVVERDTKQQRDAAEKAVGERQAQWEQSLLGPDGKLLEPTWQPLTPDNLQSEQGTQLEKLEDSSVLAKGKSPDKDNYTLNLNPILGSITGFKLEVLPDASFVNKGPGRADNGNFVLNEFQVRLNDKPIDLVAVNADFEQQGWPLAGAVDGKPETGWAIMPSFGQTHTAIFQVREPVAGDTARLSCKLMFQFGRQHTLGHFKLYATTAPPELLHPLPAEIRAILLKARDARSDAEKIKLTEYHRDNDPQVADAKKRCEDAQREREAFENSIPRTMVMRDRAQPRDTFILIRGAYDKYGEKVTPGVPAVLPALPEGAPPNRLALARWLVSPSNPLTARVTVNRYWQSLFGTGIVKTVDDFGVQGEKPSHPELLDWLACEFMQPTVAQPTVANALPNNAWNLKHILRLMVTSATYRQSSKTPSGLAERDPENRLLAHGPRYRLPSWMIRDQALAASGLLVEKLGGPPVKGYQPPGIWEDATFGIIRYEPDHGAALYRRSLYQFWRRIVGPTEFFDVGNRQTCQVKINRTNTPLQALVTLNDVTYVEAARVLAQRVMQEATTPAARIALAYQLLVARQPSKAETAVLMSALKKFHAQFAKDPASAKKLLSMGESPRDEHLDVVEHAAYTALSNVILNLDETLTKE
ncbi:MAG: PSD1 domain-containing protein [Abitibacteriaceae bacterium]|nr:PSD1 domain-containing protein [Abditibacteriaceae bacterium]